MRKLGLSLSLTSAAMAVRSAFKIASVNPVLWWDAESHRAGLAGGAATLFQDSFGTSAVSAVEQPVGRAVDQSGNARHALQATSTARPLLTARKNLLTYSGRFDAPAWTKNLSAAAVASAGIKITPGGAGYAGVYQQSSAIAGATSATVFTAHAYMSSAGKTLVYLSTDNTANRGAVFNLAAGTVVFVATGYTATIRPSPEVGEGVYKCSITFVRASALAYPFIGPADNANGTSSGPSTDGIVVHGMQLEYGSAATSYQRVTTATDYDITSAPLMLQFDGVDDALSTGTFAAGTLPANADVYVVLGRSPGSGTVSVCSASPFKYLAVAEAGSNSRPDGESGVPGYAVNGVAISSTRNALHAELQRDGVARLLEVRGADLSSWLSFGVSAYAGIGLLGRIGAVLITPAQPDATRAKIRKALAKAYQIQGVV